MKRRPLILKYLARSLDSLISHSLLLVAALVFLFGFYALWDSHQVQVDASPFAYESYKPRVETKENDLATFEGFDRLKKLNPDVLGWLTIYGTGIDYPLVQSKDNDTYLNKDATGKDNVTGALFLDYRSSPKFDDFNTIIHGHHVENGVMFGDLAKFTQKSFFDSHRYGTIFYEGKERGIEILAILEADAYDATLYQPGIWGDANRLTYYERAMAKALHKRKVGFKAYEQLLLLSTCFLEVANGRYVVLAKVTDKVHPNPFSEEGQEPFPYNLFGDSKLGRWLKAIPLWAWYLIILCLLLTIIVLLLSYCRVKKRQKES